MSITTLPVWRQIAAALGGQARSFGLHNTRTLANRVSDIGEAAGILEVYGTHTLTTSLEIPDNVTVVMKPGSVITLNAGVTLGINGCCKCEGSSHFVLSATSWLIFGEYFDAPTAADV